MNRIKPPRLEYGDTIGIIAPCMKLAPDTIANAVKNLREKGFRVTFSKNLFSDTNGFAGSPRERADDFNSMILNPEVKMLYFEGGEVCNEILPYLDYPAIRKNPKILCSYSDSTTLLNAVYCKTGLVTFYGSSLMVFDELQEYNLQCFADTLMKGSTEYHSNSRWEIINGGACEGMLIGGYLANFAFMQNTAYFKTEPAQKLLLIIEDHESFSCPAAVSRYFSHIEQSGLFGQVTGLIIGNYSERPSPQLVEILKRIAEKYQIPVVKNDDFGHGRNHAILPIGISAKLDAQKENLAFLESGVV